MFIQIGAIALLYFTLRKASPFTQSTVLFSLLLLGVLFHFLKWLYNHIKSGELKNDFIRLRDKVVAMIKAPNPYYPKKAVALGEGDRAEE